MPRFALTALLACLAACGGERPVRDLDDAQDVTVRDATALDAPSAQDVNSAACGDAGARAVPTTLTAAGRCTPRSTGRWCEGEVAVRTCGTRAGEAEPARFPCGAGERCVMRGDRGACEPTGACRPGQTRCAGNASLARCEGGAWVEAPCASRCVGDGLGAACVDLPAVRALRGTLRYARRLIADDLLSWRAPTERPARGFAVHYRRGEALLARAVTDAQGAFTLDAPTTPLDGDVVVAVAAHGEDGRTVVMVGDPGLAAGSYRTFENPATGAAWTWQWPVPADGASLTIAVENSAGASVFDDVRGGYVALRGRLGAAPRHSLAVWVKRGVIWDCGACFSELVPVTAAGQRYDGQLWITGERSEPWWSDAVTLHELGHWAMSAWGTIPHEGGLHQLGVPTLPGLAWSEGWASWVSSDLRGDPRHYAVFEGTFFWWNIALRQIYNGAVWQRPNPTGSLLQAVDENEVSAILWGLREEPGAARVYRAMASPRMVVAPFARCNTQTYYAPGGTTCTSGEYAPHLADILDALRCDGVSESVVRVAAGTYPYPASTPRCEVGCAATACVPRPACSARSPLTLSVHGLAPGRLAVSLAQPGDLAARTTVRLALPAGVTRTDGPTRWSVAAHTDHTETVTLAGPAGLTARVEVVAEVQGPWAGARATAVWSGPLAEPVTVQGTATASRAGR
jgi:hypothetical protein